MAIKIDSEAKSKANTFSSRISAPRLIVAYAVQTLGLVCLFPTLSEAKDPRSVIAPTSTAQPPRSPMDWVHDLGAPQFHARIRARDELLRMSTDAIPALYKGIQFPDLEIRKQSASLLKELQVSNYEREVQRMLQSDEAGLEYELDGWDAFRQSVGDSKGTRQLFGQFARRYRQELSLLESNTTNLGDLSDLNWPEDPHAFLSGRIGIDASKIDPIEWAWQIYLVCQDAPFKCVRTHRLRNGLCTERVHQRLHKSQHEQGLRSLVAAFLDHQQSVDSALLQIAIRWNCKSSGIRLARLALAPHTTASPRTVSTSLSFLARHAPDEGKTYLLQALEDHRPAQTWRILARSRRRVLTQVDDIAFALLLHQEGIDPRDVGFTDIEADAYWIYQDHTIGFSSDQERKRTHEAARKRLDLSSR
ncbi:hypothetical protein FF011L_24340 [Roseimaritima multifibrata]|uniref:Uncharacterized protein n=1 Tax=Roseimaritima multifibrata TaxID=1930274 RepID=A0A517MFJ4_9BACT|nr:hypothetical protein [Roseimaritima multifibrata]QDS93661.1 hypothetical protein FF011L_24340 [Roseimaritima multifibrata]